MIGLENNRDICFITDNMDLCWWRGIVDGWGGDQWSCYTTQRSNDGRKNFTNAKTQGADAFHFVFVSRKTNVPLLSWLHISNWDFGSKNDRPTPNLKAPTTTMHRCNEEMRHVSKNRRQIPIPFQTAIFLAYRHDSSATFLFSEATQFLSKTPKILLASRMGLAWKEPEKNRFN